MQVRGVDGMVRKAFREQRLLRSWSLERAAAEIADLAQRRGFARPGVDGNAVGRWERGAHHPGAFYTPLVCELYGKTATELGLEFESRTVGGPRSTLSAVERREFLQLLAGAGLNAALPAGEHWERLEQVLSRGASLDPVAVAALEAQTASLHQLELQIPARHLASRLEIHLDRLTQLLEQSSSPPLQRRLIATTGDAASLAAWTAWDRGDQAAAARFYELAALAAREGDDPALRGCLLAYASYGSASPQQAMELLQGARSYVDSPAQPALWAWVAGREAEEAAQSGLEGHALRLLEQALEVYGSAQVEGARAWTCFLDSTRMQGFAISTYSRLGHIQTALKTAEGVLADLGTDNKMRSILLADVASVHLQHNDVDAGIQAATQSLETARATECSVGFDRLRRIRPQLAAWADLPAARQLDEQLQEIPA
jgi:hypothetical protein